MHPTLKFFIDTFACDEARQYVYKSIEDYGFSDQELWEDCNRPEWMMWIIKKLFFYHSFEERTSTISVLVKNVMDAAYKRSGFTLLIKGFETFDQDLYSIFAGAILCQLTVQQRLAPSVICDLIREQYPQISTLIEQCEAARNAIVDSGSKEA